MASNGAVLAKCASNALGTSRTITLDPKKHRAFMGDESSLGLRSKEVILTFDDGPIARKTPGILKALKKECVKATFFYVGKMARAYPKLVRQVVAHGHTLAHHTHSHDRLPDFESQDVSKLIDRGVSSLQKIAYNDASSTPRTPFFRYPYLARNARTDKLLADKGMITFAANIDSMDWKSDSPQKVHDRIMRKLKVQKKGIILMHDIQSRTVKMLPGLLRSLKSEGYRVVHMVAKPGKAASSPDMVIASLRKTSPRIGYSRRAAQKPKTRLGVSKRSEMVVELAQHPKTPLKRRFKKTPVIGKQYSKRKNASYRLQRRRLALRRGQKTIRVGSLRLRRSQWILR